MRILVSNLFLYPSKVGGAEHYFYNLLTGIKANSFAGNLDLVINKRVMESYEEVVHQYKRIALNVRWNRGIYDYLLGFFINDISKYDIAFSPNYITAIFLPRKIKKITTIHDVQYLHYPEFFSKTKRIWLYLSHLITLNAADKVICISKSVKNDLIYFFGEKYKNKLEVIYNPIDFNRFQDSSQNKDMEIGGNFILSVAAQYPHKNLLTLIRAFNNIDTRYKYKLVLAGQLSENLIGNYSRYFNDLQKEIEKNKENIILTGYISNNYLGQLYKTCDIFVFPSIFEGFGMPPIEAMGHGVPTITTRCASLEEVTLGKAIYINNPKDANELKSLIEHTIENLESYRYTFRKIKKHIRNVYNPRIISKKYLNLFKQITDEEKKNN